PLYVPRQTGSSSRSKEALHPSTALVISYHPPIFKPLSSFTLSSPLQASLLRLVATGVSVYSPHTALDSVKGGINDWLAHGLVDPNSSPTEQAGVSYINGPILEEDDGGKGRLVALHRPVSIEELVTRIKKHLGVEHGERLVIPIFDVLSPPSSLCWRMCLDWKTKTFFLPIH
ncbi:hypothetical protein ID866_10392, partial [Astraeus odoratus]